MWEDLKQQLDDPDKPLALSRNGPSASASSSAPWTTTLLVTGKPSCWPWVADHHPDNGVEAGDSDGGLTPEVGVCRSNESHVELPDIYPVVSPEMDGFAGCHTVACFPVVPERKTYIYVDLTARQYGEHLPCPIIWEGLPPTYLR